MISFPRAMLAVACALSLQSAGQAANHASSLQAQAMLDKAVAEVKVAGPDKAFAEFNESKGAYNTRELYVFAFSMKGVYEASGADPKLVGSNALDLTDVEGKRIVREMIDVTKTKGHGRVDYIWLNRLDNRVEHKRSLVQRVGDHIIGVGYYAG